MVLLAVNWHIDQQGQSHTGCAWMEVSICSLPWSEHWAPYRTSITPLEGLFLVHPLKQQFLESRSPFLSTAGIAGLSSAIISFHLCQEYLLPLVVSFELYMDSLWDPKPAGHTSLGPLALAPKTPTHICSPSVIRARACFSLFFWSKRCQTWRFFKCIRKQGKHKKSNSSCP